MESWGRACKKRGVKEDRKQPGKELDGGVEAEVNQMRQIDIDPSASCLWLEANDQSFVFICLRLIDSGSYPTQTTYQKAEY